jgi:hypothetical protein
VSKRKEIEEEPLNLVPIMNLVTILIPVLLIAIKSLELAVIDTTLPAIQQETTEQEKPENPPLSLTMALTKNGIKLIGADAYLYPDGGAPKAAEEGGQAPPTVPCLSGGKCRNMDDYNWPDLLAKLTTIKEGAIKDDKDSDNVIFLPEHNIKYEIIIMAMDTSRENPNIREAIPGGQEGEDQGMKLFPNVVMAGGVK